MISSFPALLLFCASFVFIGAFASEDLPLYNYSEVEKWGSKHPNYTACSTGKRQSPIDINTNDVVINKNMQPLTRNYHIYNASLSTDGIEVEVVFTGRGDLMFDGETYKLKQMHWHTPSEHRLNGVQYAAELHQVYVAADGSRSVVGILFEYGKPDPVLTMLKPQLDELAKEPCQDHERIVAIPRFDSRFLRRRPRKYYRYPGSLTTPPCDENVIWNVITKVKSISKDQVEALKAPLCEANKIKNARPAQPLNGRRVQLYDGN
ncbi:alpha carbonic anhydrase 1, chloroplastic-like [Chenopodium quinoa]|uniref:Alpha-carbonic anhydrase domain-containing protein n=1 Tax=Chenopodium quinoa TaxID=63459 RepID=A0A803L2U9_CHEQI|nr:alpha carbonic anhydrase 1, chloroplastic-like [Chenopodium quinoa]